jgi:RpiB/LacA/LacB family sugar-phosphate isomerase
MRIGIATDHGGFGLKEELVAQLRAAGHDVVDFGANSLSPDDDYPDFVTPLGHAVATGQVERGVAICGSGVGASVCANKIPGARAALIHDHFSARQGVEDDHMNILYMGAAGQWDRRWLGTSFRPSWPPSSVRPNDICAGWARWRRSKQRATSNEWILTRAMSDHALDP